MHIWRMKRVLVSVGAITTGVIEMFMPAQI